MDAGLVAKHRGPQLFSPVRGKRSKQLHDDLGNLVAARSPLGVCGTLFGACSTQEIVRAVHELHDGGNRGVEVVAVDVVGHLAHHAMALAHQRLESIGGIQLGVAIEQRILARLALQVVHGAPHAVQELVQARKAVFVPQQLFVRRSHEQNVATHGIGAIGGNHIFRRNDVALRLRHNVAVLVEHHALAQQIRERLIEVQHALVAQHLREEATVEQMQNGMLDAADVLVDRQPRIRLSGIERALGVVRIGIAHVIPARARKRVHGVGLATSLATTLRARALREFLVRSERLTSGKVNVLGKAHRQIFFRNRHDATLRAMNRRNGIAPIALTRNEPVAQAEFHLASAAAHGLELSDDSCLTLGMLAAGHAGVFARLHKRAFGGVGLGPIDRGDHAVLLVFQLLEQRVVIAQDDGNDGQVVFASEFEVALVAARNSHNGTRAVIGNDIVGNPDGQLFAINGIDRVTTGKLAVLFVVALGALHRGDLLGGLDEIHNRLLVFGTLDKRRETLVFRGKHEEARAEQRVGTRGEHGDDIVFGRLGGHVAVFVAQHEVDLGAFGAANPVGLLLLHALGPAFELVKIVEQFLSVIGDLQVPLREVALLDFGIAAPATALDNLLVRQNGLAARAPIHGRVAALDEATLPELLKNPLAPAIVLGVARHNGAVPVVGKAHALEAGLLGFDVGIRPFGRMAMVLDGSIFCRQAEGVPTHGMQNVEALHAIVASNNVANRIVTGMAHVNVARGIREHFQDVLLGTPVFFMHLVDAAFFPSRLPTRLDLEGIVFLHVCSC